jgi:hypothetical protein
MKAIPASEIVRVIPSVLAPAGLGLSLNSVFITDDASIPNGSVLEFPTLQAVKDFFGSLSDEAVMAATYFNGFEGASILPSTIFFARWLPGNAAAYLRSGSIAALSLADIQALSGSITISVDGVSTVSDAIDLSSATSFSNAAALVQTGIRAGTPSNSISVSYDAQLHSFVITSSTTGASSTIAFPTTASLATGLKLTEATGAVLSQGGAASVAADLLDAIVATTQNWALFTTVFTASADELLAFADWANDSNDRYAFVGWDTDTGPTLSPNDTGSFGNQTLDFDGRIAVWGSTVDSAQEKAAFVCGLTASINFLQTNGRVTYDFKRQSGLTVDVTDATVAQNLLANGYNFYGNWATANDQFKFLNNGQISGQWLWIDEYVNQIKLNSDLQLAFMTLLTSVNAIPYNARGYNLIRAAAADPINNALNFGSIQPGVQLSALQIAEIDTSAGVSGVARAVQQLGYYLQVKPADPSVRPSRGSPPITLWYASGGSIQKIDMASIDVL